MGWLFPSLSLSVIVGPKYEMATGNWIAAWAKKKRFMSHASNKQDSGRKMGEPAHLEL